MAQVASLFGLHTPTPKIALPLRFLFSRSIAYLSVHPVNKGNQLRSVVILCGAGVASTGRGMWTPENRPNYDRRKLRYPSDLTDEEWALIGPLIPPAKPGGNKRTVDMRAVVNGVM